MASITPPTVPTTPTTVLTATTATSYPVETASNTATSWLPLTTPFIQHPDCVNANFIEILTSDPTPTFVAYIPGINIGTITCLPPEVTSWFSNRQVNTYTIDFGQTTSLAPAISLMPLHCPDGWRTALKETVQSTSVKVTCCPSGYTANASPEFDIEANCFSTIPPEQVISFLPASDTTLLQTSFLSSITVAAVAIKGWNIDSTSSVSTVTQTIAVPTTDPQTSSSDPSTRYIAAAVAAVTLVAFGAFLLFWWQKTTKKGNDKVEVGLVPIPTPHQQDYSVVFQNETGCRLGAVLEMPTRHNIAELPEPNMETSWLNLD